MKLRLFKALFSVVALTSLAVSAQAGGSMEQCANGGIGDPVVACTEANGAWITGNVNSSKGHFLEGEVMPYRYVITSHTGTTGHVQIEWDTTKGGTHATDYITTFNATEGTADPCTGVASVNCGLVTTFPIPLDLNLAAEGFMGTLVDLTPEFTLYGGTITSLSLIHVTDPVDGPTAYAGDGSTSIRVNFTVPTDGDDLVLAWGGHISSSLDWDGEPTAVTIPGSPYHMRLLDASEGTGNQDLSLSANAIILPNPTITLAKDVVPNDATPNFLLQVTGEAAEAVGDGGSGTARTVPAGAISFSESDGTGLLANYSSAVVCTDNIDGTTVVPLDVDGGTSGTVTLVLNQNVTCTFTNTLDNANLTLAKSVSPAGETFNLQVTGFGAEELGDGASGTQRSVAANTEITFNEADGTGTLTDYTSSIECRDDGDNALVSLDTDNQTDGGGDPQSEPERYLYLHEYAG